MLAISLEIAAVLLLILIGCLLRMLESALLSARRTRLQQLADDGKKGAKAALELMAAPEHLSTTVQLWITAISVLAGALGGATIVDELVALKAFSYEPYAEALSVTLVVVLITFFFVVLGELLPRKLALSNPEDTACALAVPMRALMRSSNPGVKLLESSVGWILLRFGVKQRKGRLAEEEIEALVEEGSQKDALHESEKDMLSRILRLDGIRISSVMTPLSELVWLDARETSENLIQKIGNHGHTRYVVGDGGLDGVLGVVNGRDLLLQVQRSDDLDLQAALYSPLIVPGNKTALEVLDHFKQSRLHVAFVMDEYGCLRGLVTMSDIMEAIVGDLSEVGESETWQVDNRQDGEWLFDAITPIAQFKNIVQHKTEFPGEEKASYRTLGGFVLDYLEHIPAVTEQFECAGLRFEILEMDRNRINKILVARTTKSELKN
jgi:putative hemolysin